MYIKHLNFNKKYSPLKKRLELKKKFNISKIIKKKPKKLINAYSVLKYKNLLKPKKISLNKSKKALKFIYLLKKKKFQKKFLKL